MKQKYFIISAFLVVVIGSGIYLKVQNGNQPASITQSENKANNQTAQLASSGGTYVDYHESIITETSGKKILFFYAPWCPQCRAVEADINKQGVPTGVTIIKIDYDSNQALRKKYGVTIQTTFVKVDDNGNKTKLYVAYNEPTLGAVIRNILEPVAE